MSAKCVAGLGIVLGVALAGVASASKPHERLSDADRGAQLYMRHCAACHGAEAAGDGPVAPSLVASVPDLREAMTDDAMGAQVEVILTGRQSMPAYALSFDRLDARRVWRHMQRAATGRLSEPDGADSEQE